MERLNIGLVGGGFMAKAHSLAYAGMPMFFWPPPAVPYRYMVAEVSRDRAAEAAARFGYEKYVDDWRELVEDPRVDVVDIATPNDLHAEVAIAAADAGKHVISEKPLARSSAEAESMLRAVEKAGVVHMVAFNYRRTPAVALAKQFIDSGVIGSILNFRGTYLQDWSADPYVPRSWRFQKAKAGSGALGDIGTHVLDMARFLVGEIVAVNAVLRTYVAERPMVDEAVDKLGAWEKRTCWQKGVVDVDDEVLTLMRFANGAVGSLEATRNAYGRKNHLAFEVHGSAGSVYFNYERRDELQAVFASDPPDRHGFRTIYTGPGHPYGEAMWPLPGLGIGYGETKIIEVYEFCRAVAMGRGASPDFRDGYRIEQIAEAIAESGGSGAWVRVGDVVAGEVRS